MAKRKLDPPPRSRQTSSGNWTTQIELEEDGQLVRRSPNTILHTLPRSFATIEELWQGYNAAQAFLATRADHRATVAGFWARWTDPSDWRWGADMTGRGTDTYAVYASKTRSFVGSYGDRQIAAITEADVREHMNGGGRAAHLLALKRFFADAESEGLHPGPNPAGELARVANRTANERRRKEKRRSRPPQRDVVDRMLAHATRPEYPRSFYGWLLTGVRTGLRSGELDGMTFAEVEGDEYKVRHQLHYRENELREPKHASYRRVQLPADVLAEIAAAPRDSEYVWLNTGTLPWREASRIKWWEKRVAGTSLREIVGGATIYQATRHHWADYALNVMEMRVENIATLYGHKDGGKTLLEFYADTDNDAALNAVRGARASEPVDLSQRRRAA
jgi:hypothetical protein